LFGDVSGTDSSSDTPSAQAFDGENLVDVQDFLNPFDSEVVSLANSLFAEGIIRHDMSETEKLEAIMRYVNENYDYREDGASDG
jgi:hypothetical protein